MKTKKYDIAVVIGRFQPLHNGHVRLLNEAAQLADQVNVLVGSANASVSIKNPFTFSQRHTMILAAFQGMANISVRPLNDFTYNDNKWISQVQTLATAGPWSDYPKKVVLVGHTKDESSYYLKNFPDWDYHEVPADRAIDATDIRELLFTRPLEFVEGVVPRSTFEFLERWTDTDAFFELEDEHAFVKKYKDSWKAAPYAPTFVTVDAVVVQQGHVLMVRRAAAPGKGLRALPGGFLDQTETLIDGMVRELREETGLKIPEKVLKGSVVSQRMFDSPGRSLRGRTLTMAYYIVLETPPDGKLPRVKGGDDAALAEWVPLADIRGQDCFEDHAHIINYFTGA